MLVNFLTDTRENSLFFNLQACFLSALYSFGSSALIRSLGSKYIQQFPFVSCQMNCGYGVSH